MGPKTLALLALSAVVLFLVAPAQAAPPRTLILPPSADNSPVISLGTAIDPASGNLVEGQAIIHQKNNPAKPGNKPGGSTVCYGYLAKGAKWKALEPWIVNPANARGLDPAVVFNLLTGGIVKWEAAAGVNVLGDGSATADALLADIVSPDNQNEVYFADITDSNAIAVTIVWGIFGGPPAGRQLVEWDQVYDDVTFDWSAEPAGVAGKMDFDNIATHELGHSVGMADLYNTCVDETMYGYSAAAETKKRDLNTGDITGVNALY